MITILPILKNKYLPFLFAIPLFFCVYHYNGIVMDAILYVTQYVYTIDPMRFSGDPSFDYGNQNSLGFFSPIFGLFLESMGIAAGAFTFTLLTQLMWVVAAVFLIKSLLRLAGYRLWIIPATILFACIFSNGMPFSHIIWFHFLSSYACSRALSIVLCLIGIGLIFYQKRVLSLSFIIMGTIVHPISSGWGIVLWMFYFFPKIRVPVVIFSLFFPITFLLHYGVFDVYPTGWLSKPLALGPRHDLIARYVFLLSFFGILRRKSLNKHIQNISFSMCLLIAIAFYWNVWGGYGEHIFLYQVQPWRALWIPSLIAVPLSICLVIDSIKSFAKTKKMTTYDLGIFLLFVSFFPQENIVFVSVISLFLLLGKKRILYPKDFIAIFAIFLILEYILQQYITWVLEGFPVFLDYPVIGLYHIKNSFYIYILFFTIGFAVFFFKRRQFVSVILLISSLCLSRFMLLPILPFYLSFVPTKSKAKYWVGCCSIILLIIFDGMIDVDARNQLPVYALPSSFLRISFISITAFIAIYLSKWISYKGIISWFIVSSAIAIFCYCSHSVNWMKKETPLDTYLHKTIFPQITERGRILFNVAGDYAISPRLQFVTGCYYDASTIVGTLFFKKHYDEALKRSHLLYRKGVALDSNYIFEYPLILTKLTNTDTLVDRTEYLCKINEIHHLISDKIALPFQKKDSTLVNDAQKVYLYECPP